MKTHLTIIITGIAIISVTFNILQYNSYLDKKPTYYINDGLNFVWNDDLESIPVDGTPIMLEYTDKNTVYIGPLETETNSAEYQFTITDDSISVQDFDRYVGTVKLEGQLKQLLIKDNE